MRRRIGVVVNRVVGVDNVVALTRRAEELGFYGAWLTSGPGEDCMPLLAALAVGTERIRLGTSVAQTAPRHPLVMAAEVNVLDQLAPGRVRLGVGPSHRVFMEAMGLSYEDPFGELREYVQILRSLFSTGEVEFAGRHYRVSGRITRPVDVPVMIGTVQPSTFRLTGELGDGAITWLCPPEYLARVAVPAMANAAARAGRPTPPLVAHLAVCVHEDAQEVRDEVRRSIPNITLPSYQRMLVTAGYAAAAHGVWTDELVDAIVAWGDETAVLARVESMFAAGAHEVLVRPLGAGARPDEVIDRTMGCLAAMSREG